MSSLENEINGDIRDRHVDTRGTTGNFTDMEASLKREKARTKSNFTRLKNKVLFLIEQRELPSHQEIQEACSRMDSSMESAMDVMTSLSELYTKYKEKGKNDKVILEIFSTAYETARQYIDAQKERSSDNSEILSVEMLNRMNISDRSETYRIDGPNVSQEVGFVNSYSNARNSMPLKNSEIQTHTTTEGQNNDIVYETEPTPLYITDTPMQNDHSQELDRAIVSKNRMNAQAKPFESTTSNNHSPSIGQDLWRQLKRVQIPVFAGDKKTYQNWKAAFLACIDSAPATAEYKPLQLWQYLSGEALKVIDSLGHSATAYEAAKQRLERKYGGKRRQIAIYLEELEQFPQIRSGNAKDVEDFADLLDIAMINLEEAGQHYELGDGSLYTKLQCKMPEEMLARYHRWIFEHNKEESVLALREWIIQESEFQTIATETVRGFTKAPSRPAPRYGNQRTFFGEAKSGRNSQKIPCQDCGMNHGIWNCPEFNRRRVADRWKVAKQNQLCYRCLAQGHQGKACPRSRPCGLDGCTDLHHRLLHKEEHTKQLSVSLDNNDLKRIKGTALNPRQQDMPPHLTDRDSCSTEGKEQTTMVTENNIRTNFIGLRTVPVILKKGEQSLKINALLDDASTKSYVNADIATELGLQGKPEKMTVNVLNGQVETFETSPINVELMSMTGNVRTRINACTVDRVTGNMPVIEWNKYKNRWPHLRNIDFPTLATRPIVDMLLGLDCADLIYAIQEVRGKPGEPIARLTPLGWTCIGNISSEHQEVCHANFAAYTYFVKHQAETAKINATLKQFWKIEDVHSPHDVPIVCMEEQLAMKKIENTLSFENLMHRAALQDNYELTLSRLGHTDEINLDIELSNLKKASSLKKSKQPRTETIETNAWQTFKNSLTEKEGRVTNLNLQLEQADDHLQKTPQDLCVEQKQSTELKSKMETLQQTASKRVQMLEALSRTEWEQHAQCQLLKKTLDSVTQEVSYKNTQVISYNVNLGSQKDIDAESARELQPLKQQRSEDLEPDIEEMKAGDKLRVQELEIDRASMKPEFSNTNCVIKVAEEQCRTLQTENKQLEYEVLKEKTSVRQITAEKGELQQYLEESTKEQNALILKKNKVIDELIKLKHKLQAILHKHEAEAHKQHDNFEIKYSALTSEEGQMASEQDGPRLLRGGKENVMGLQQDKLKRHSFETDFSDRKAEILELQHMPIWKEDTIKTLASFEAELRNIIQNLTTTHTENSQLTNRLNHVQEDVKDLTAIKATLGIKIEMEQISKEIQTGDEEINILQEQPHTLKPDLNSNKVQLLFTEDIIRKAQDRGTICQDFEGMYHSLSEKKRQLDEVRDCSEEIEYIQMECTTERLRLEKGKTTPEKKRYCEAKKNTSALKIC